MPKYCHFLDQLPTPMSLHNVKMAPNKEGEVFYKEVDRYKPHSEELDRIGCNLGVLATSTWAIFDGFKIIYGKIE